MKKEESLEKYLKMLISLRKELQKTSRISLLDFSIKNSVSKNLSTSLRNLGIIKQIKLGRYPNWIWTGGEPNERMAKKVLSNLAELNHKRFEHSNSDDKNYTYENIEKIRNTLLSWKNKTFSASEIAKASGVGIWYFYKFLYSGIVYKVCASTYAINKDMIGLDANFIQMESNRITRNKETSKFQLKNAKPKSIIEIKNDFEMPFYKTEYTLNENDCIDYLKSKGYRILKPIQEYKEI